MFRNRGRPWEGLRISGCQGFVLFDPVSLSLCDGWYYQARLDHITKVICEAVSRLIKVGRPTLNVDGNVLWVGA